MGDGGPALELARRRHVLFTLYPIGYILTGRWIGGFMTLRGGAVMAVERPHAAPCVLIVDDEPEVRAFICEILETDGYRTRALASGTAALELAPTERPALMLLDIYLPDLDGYTVANRLRALPALASTPIIFITGADAPVHGTLSRGLGAVYLKKPFTATQLLRAVGQALQGSAEAR